MKGNAKKLHEEALLRDQPHLEFFRAHAATYTQGQMAEMLGWKRYQVWKLLARHPDIPRNHRRGGLGPRNGSWNGGRTIDADGYVLIRSLEHPSANSAGYVREHRLVVEESLGRYLLPTEVVHHKNGNTGDNRLENLELLPSNAQNLRYAWNGKQHTPETREKMVQAALLRERRKREQQAGTSPSE
jgi:hypothetical protein